MGPPSPKRDFDRAVQLFLERTSKGEAGETDDEFLARNGDVRELLEGLLFGAEEEDASTTTLQVVTRSPDDLVGEELAGLRIERVLGRGGMGWVFEAEQLSMGRRVAVKMLNTERQLDPTSLARFRREATAGGRLEHPGVVRTLDWKDADGVALLVQELVPGGRTLATEIEELRRKAELPAGHVRRAVEIAALLAEALAAAHEKGIVHRDVKPSNVLLAPDGTPKLADFGAARLHDSLQVTRTHFAVGTPFCVAPEVARGESAEPASDQFSLAVTLYELLTLVRPFAGESNPEVLRRIVEDDAVDPRRHRASIPADLAGIVLRGLEKEPHRRYASAGAMAADLRRFLAGGDVEASPPGAVRRASRWVKRRPGRSVAGVAVALGLVAFAVVFVQIRSQLDAYLDLTDEAIIEELEKQAEDLRVLDPSMVAPAIAWIGVSEEVVARRAHHARRLGELKERSGGELTLEEEWRRRALTRLVAGIDRLADPVDGGIVRMRRHLDTVARLQAETVDSDEAKSAWAKARRAIAGHPLYGGLDMPVLFGVLPIGVDPKSGFWEFCDLASGVAPLRDENEVIVRDPDMGIVLVLIPGGSAWIGAQDLNPEGANYYEPWRGGTVEAGSRMPFLASFGPFLFGKYEVTQNQYERLTGTNPSVHKVLEGRREWSGLLPVEQVRWDEGVDALWRASLRYASELEWEYATRAGTQGRWFFGAPALFPEFANVRDVSGERGGGEPAEDLDDGFRLTAPVGEFEANPWGLHDVHGNVFEWTSSFFREYDGFVDKLNDRERRFGDGSKRVYRGGSFQRLLGEATSDRRAGHPESWSYEGVGLRAARTLFP